MGSFISCGHSPRQWLEYRLRITEAGFYRKTSIISSSAFIAVKKSLDTQGVGLGLPLAKAIVEGQKGVISVKSELGEGTAFTISFLTDS